MKSIQLANQYRKSTTIPGSSGIESFCLDNVHLSLTACGVMPRAYTMLSPRPHTRYHHLGHCRPRPTSRWSTMLVGCLQSGASATRSAKLKSWIHATREHVTLDYLHNKRTLSFAIPDVYYHAEYDGRYHIILSELSGQTLIEAWPNMDEAMKQHYVARVANICRELVWRGNIISGVDGRYLSDHFLTRLRLPTDCSPRNLLNSCKDLGMDCSAFIFYHCDLGPGNIIVKPAERSTGIIDWETAGFVPKEWIRTKFCISSWMDLPGQDQVSRVDWRRRVQKQLEKEGFSEIADQWMVWWSNKD